MAFPISRVTKPACLNGQSNGRLSDSILVSIPGLAGGPVIRLVEPAARAWKALQSAALAAGHTLKATSAADSYRPYADQERIFRARYTTQYLAGRPFRLWQGQRWYQRPGTAMAAVPGTSNHGLALAVDTGTELDGDAGTEAIDKNTLAWLLNNARSYGFSWEVQSEPWHLHYFAGDAIPAAVIAFEHSQQPQPQPQPNPVPVPPADHDDDEDDSMFCFRNPADGKVWLVEGRKRRHISRNVLDALKKVGTVTEPPSDENDPHFVTQDDANALLFAYTEA
jgi:hypothetical protein